MTADAANNPQKSSAGMHLATESRQRQDLGLGARLAAASRRAQGFASVSDPAVLAELRELCAAPRPVGRTVAGMREGPAS